MRPKTMTRCAREESTFHKIKPTHTSYSATTSSTLDVPALPNDSFVAFQIRVSILRNLRAAVIQSYVPDVLHHNHLVIHYHGYVVHHTCEIHLHYDPDFLCILSHDFVVFREFFQGI